MASLLRDLTENLRMLVPVAIPGRTGALVIEGDPSYEALKAIVAGLKDDPELDVLSPEELRSLTTFKITVFRAGEMAPDMARKHIGAAWRGAAKQALLKLSAGENAEACMRDLMAGGIG